MKNINDELPSNKLSELKTRINNMYTILFTKNIQIYLSYYIENNKINENINNINKHMKKLKENIQKLL